MRIITVVPPFRGELGIMIRYHVPAVYALPRPVVVCHEPGKEALYPDCERIMVTSRPDKERRWIYGRDDAFVKKWIKKLRRMYPKAHVVMPDDRKPDRKEKRFIPDPFVEQRNGQAPPEVVLCPRKREYADERNWDGWMTVAKDLCDRGVRVFAAGTRETSYNIESHERSWQYTRKLDATIEALKASKLVVATDAGVAHLAVLCGAPLLLVASNGGLAAPGPRRDDDGKITHETWPIRLKEYYEKANHTGSMIEMVPHGWENSEQVVNRVLEIVR